MYRFNPDEELVRLEQEALLGNLDAALQLYYTRLRQGYSFSPIAGLLDTPLKRVQNSIINTHFQIQNLKISLQTAELQMANLIIAELKTRQEPEPLVKLKKLSPHVGCRHCYTCVKCNKFMYQQPIEICPVENLRPRELCSNCIYG